MPILDHFRLDGRRALITGGTRGLGLEIARALGADSAAGGIFALASSLGAPVALKDIGMPADGLDRAADLATTNAYWNPRPLDRGAIRQLLQDAWEGKYPT